MPTFNQLVRKGRQTVEKKSTAPALQKGLNSLKKKATDISCPQRRGVSFLKNCRCKWARRWVPTARGGGWNGSYV